MVVCCAVANCTSRSKKGSGITFHRFPADKELFAKWVRATGRPNYKPSDFAKVCSMHFHNDDMYRDKYNRRFLKKGVVPSRFYIVRKIRRRMKLIFATIPEPSNEVVISNEDTEEIGPTTKVTSTGEKRVDAAHTRQLPNSKLMESEIQELIRFNSEQTSRNSSFKQTNTAEKSKPVKSVVIVSKESMKVLNLNTEVAPKSNEELGGVFLEDQLHNSQFVESEVVISSEDTEVIDSVKELIPKSNEEESTCISSERRPHNINCEKNDENTETTAVIISSLEIPSKLFHDQRTEFLNPKTNGDCNEEDIIDNNIHTNISINSETSTLKTDLSKLSRSSPCQTNKVEEKAYVTRTREIGLEGFEKLNDVRPISKATKAKKRKFFKRKREIGLEDFEKINDARLADPKVVKQLLTIAYKTIQEQRKIIANWQSKHKNMERRVVQLHKTLIRLKVGQCS